MRYKILGFKKKDLPSKFGTGTWTIASVKFEGIENPEWGYDLKGFDKGTIEKLAAGQTLNGYFKTESYTGKDGSAKSKKVFVAVDNDYLYDLILKINPHAEDAPARIEEDGPNYQEPITGPDTDEVTSPGW